MKDCEYEVWKKLRDMEVDLWDEMWVLIHKLAGETYSNSHTQLLDAVKVGDMASKIIFLIEKDK